MDNQIPRLGYRGRYLAFHMPEQPPYDSPELKHLSDVEHARERPSMWLGTDDFSLAANCLARETFCLAIDEVLNGNCTQLSVGIEQQEFRLAHNGMCPDAKTIGRNGKTKLESYLTTRWICQELADDDYVADNICRLSIPTVVFLSRFFAIDAFDGDFHYRLYFDCGVSAEGLQKLGPTQETGISLRFEPDRNILGLTKFDLAKLRNWFEGLRLPHDSFTTTWTTT